MKKIFLSLVFLFGVGTFVMADDTMKVKNDTVAVEDGFKNIDLKEVPQSVKDAIAKKYPESTLKSASLSLKEEVLPFLFPILQYQPQGKFSAPEVFCQGGLPYFPSP